MFMYHLYVITSLGVTDGHSCFAQCTIWKANQIFV